MHHKLGTSQKIHHRWYLTPVQMYIFANLDDNLCWRGCSSKGSLIHILWERPQIYQFWKAFFTFISDIMGHKTGPSPSLVILSLGIDSYPKEFRMLVIHTLFAARLLIMRKWRSSLIPRITDVKYQLTLIKEFKFSSALQHNTITKCITA